MSDRHESSKQARERIKASLEAPGHSPGATIDLPDSFSPEDFEDLGIMSVGVDVSKRLWAFDRKNRQMKMIGRVVS